ncbi:helix-turn-helix domain-containing protein [Flavobacteriaceae bacterium R38]|nr:helix-turn-helix domain-containing protein [Flavobacteriaceae bacterium R38]
MRILNAGEYTGDISNRITIDGSIITNTLYSNKKSYPDWHYHDNLHICFVFQNGKAETRNNSLYTQKGGSIFFYHAEEKHRWISSGPISKSANIEIGRAFLKKYELSEFDIKTAIQNNIDAKALILKIQKEMSFNNDRNDSTILSLLLELVSYSKASYNGTLPNWVTTLNELLHDNWNEQLSLAEMAQIAGVHPVTISKFFKKYFSCTLSEYQRKLKVNKSIQLIKNTEIPLSQIAFHCGFADQSHFIRNFKEMTGFLPKHFRAF